MYPAPSSPSCPKKGDLPTNVCIYMYVAKPFSEIWEADCYTVKSMDQMALWSILSRGVCVSSTQLLLGGPKSVLAARNAIFCRTFGWQHTTFRWLFPLESWECLRHYRCFAYQGYSQEHQTSKQSLGSSHIKPVVVVVKCTTNNGLDLLWSELLHLRKNAFTLKLSATTTTTHFLHHIQ